MSETGDQPIAFFFTEEDAVSFAKLTEGADRGSPARGRGLRRRHGEDR